MAAHLGVGQRFLPGQAAQGPVVASVAWQLDVWGLQSIRWQGHASIGQLPFLMLHRLQSASDQQPLVQHMLGCKHSHQLAMPPLARYDRISACGLSCPLASGRHTVRCAPSDLAQTQASSAAQHLDSVSDRPGQPASTTFRSLRAGREPDVMSFNTTSFTIIIIIIYLTLWPLGKTARIKDCQGHDS